MTKIAAREQKSHTLDNIVEHHRVRPATAFWQAGRDSIHCQVLIEEETPSEGQRMVSGNRSSGSLGIYLGESLERKC
jgi:hypothetical protein